MYDAGVKYLCMTPEGEFVIMYDSCRSQVSPCMTPAGVNVYVGMTPV